MMKTYYAYIRVSTAEQGKGASPDEQREAITAFADRSDLLITEWFEEATTAAKAGRREFTRMLAALRGGKAAGVIIHKVDRSARNLADWARIGELVDQGIEVRFAHNDLDITTRGGRLTADIQAVIAADFIRNNREEVKKGIYGWLKRGYYPFNAPLGYQNNGKHKLKTMHPVLGPLMAEAFALYATGTYSLDTLRLALADKGLTPRGGNAISKNTLSLLLRNPFYMGLIRIKKQTFEGAHEPLVTPALFERVQETLSGRVFVRATRHPFPYRRLIRCAECPRTYTGELQKGQVYYRCHGCRGPSLRQHDIDRGVQALLSCALDEEDMRDIKEVLEHLSEEDRAGEQRRYQEIDLRLSELKDRLSRLTDALVDGALDKEAFNERKACLLADRAKLTSQRQAAAAAPFWKRTLERFELWNTANIGYSAATAAEKREMLLGLGSNFIARGKELVFVSHFPIADALHWQGVLDGAPSRCHIRIDTLGSVPKRMRTTRPELEALFRSLDQKVAAAIGTPTRHSCAISMANELADAQCGPEGASQSS